MSSSIWTQCAGRTRVRPLAGEAWRVVEPQHQVSTRKLVDSDADQLLLEELLEATKPPLPAPRLHFLLTTPFRYPPLRYGSRFGTRTETGLWYGSVAQRTAFAETAYYRLLFLAGTAAPLGPLMSELSAFRASFRTDHGIDLAALPFASHRDHISSPTSYHDSQALGRAMREAGVAAFRYWSARDAQNGLNVGLFTPRAFASRKPTVPETWRCVASRQGVEIAKKDVFARASFSFTRREFEVGGSLPAPAP
jgi:RES domain